MIRFYLQKLVRDKVVKKCLDDEEVLHTEYYTLDKQEFRRELLRKVHEEADEIPLDDNQRGESLKELAAPGFWLFYKTSPRGNGA